MRGLVSLGPYAEEPTGMTALRSRDGSTVCGERTAVARHRVSSRRGVVHDLLWIW